jgi:hypothetical protein
LLEGLLQDELIRLSQLAVAAAARSSGETTGRSNPSSGVVGAKKSEESTIGNQADAVCSPVDANKNANATPNREPFWMTSQFVKENPSTTAILQNNQKSGKFMRSLVVGPGLLDFLYKNCGLPCLPLIQIDGGHSRDPFYDGVYINGTRRTRLGTNFPAFFAAVPVEDANNLVQSKMPTILSGSCCDSKHPKRATKAWFN